MSTFKDMLPAGGLLMGMVHLRALPGTPRQELAVAEIERIALHEAMTLADRIVVMKDGVIHQCGGPLEVYDRPANRFVASFVGTPPMNFFTGALAGQGGALWFEEGAARLRLSDEMTGTLGDWAGREVVLQRELLNGLFRSMSMDGCAGWMLCLMKCWL